MSNVRFVTKLGIPSILRDEAIRHLYTTGSPEGAINTYMNNLIGCTAAQARDILFGRATLKADGGSVVLVEEPNTFMESLHGRWLQKEMRDIETSVQLYLNDLQDIDSSARERVKEQAVARPWDVYAPSNDVNSLFRLLEELPDFLNGAIRKLRAAKFCASYIEDTTGITGAENAVRNARLKLFQFCNSTLMKGLWHSTVYHVQRAKRILRYCTHATPDDHQTVWIAPDGATYGCTLVHAWLMPEIDLAKKITRKGAILVPVTNHPDNCLKQCGWLLCCDKYVTGARGMEPTPQQLTALSERAVRSYAGELYVGDGLHRVYLGDSIDTGVFPKLFN